ASCRSRRPTLSSAVLRPRGFGAISLEGKWLASAWVVAWLRWSDQRDADGTRELRVDRGGVRFIVENRAEADQPAHRRSLPTGRIRAKPEGDAAAKNTAHRAERW